MGRSVHACLAVLGLWVVFGLAACSDTTPPSLEVTSVELTGDAERGGFSLEVLGRGFLPDQLVYDLAEQRGEAAPTLAVDVFSALRESLPSDRVVVVSPRRLVAHFSSKLAAGRYGLRVRRSGHEGDVAVLEAAFTVGALGSEDASVAPDAGEDTQDGGLDRPDANLPPDSGVPPRPFVENYAFRQTVTLANTSGATAPATTTFVVPVPHAALLAAGRARSDGRDLALYLGAVRIPHAFDDPALLSTDALRLVARLPAELPVAGFPNGMDIDLYYGDPNADVRTSTTPFELLEGFAADLENVWEINWDHCNFDRPSTEPTTSPGAYCGRDDRNGIRRVTNATPLLTSVAALPANQRVEVSFHYFGAMATNTDIFYFALGRDPLTFNQTVQLAPADFIVGAPADELLFRENNNTDRTVRGWRLPPTRSGWRRSVAQFTPPFDRPSLHFRFISGDQDSNAGTEVVLDDVQVRLVLAPDLVGTLGPVETR